MSKLFRLPIVSFCDLTYFYANNHVNVQCDAAG